MDAQAHEAIAMGIALIILGAVVAIFLTVKPSALAQMNPYSPINPLQRSTWPSGNKVWAVCQAIAIAEGYNVSGSVPMRYRNPGDLGPDDSPSGLPASRHSGSNVVEFPTHQMGWDYLYKKVDRIRRGASTTYPLSLTWKGAAQKYAEWSDNWVNNVVNDLRQQGYNVSATSTLREFFA